MKTIICAVLAGSIGGLALQPVAARQSGQNLYLENCASCHGKNLEGAKNWQQAGANGIFPAPPHDVTGHTWHHGDKLLFDYTKFGGAKTMALRGVEDFKSGMPGFGDKLSDPQIAAIWEYIKSTWPAQVRAVQRERSAAE